MSRKLLSLLFIISVSQALPAQYFSVDIDHDLSRPVMKKDTIPGSRCIPDRVEWVFTGDTDHYVEHFTLGLSVIFLDKDSNAIYLKACTYPAYKTHIVSEMKAFRPGALFTEGFSGFRSVMVSSGNLTVISPTSLYAGTPPGIRDPGLEKLAKYILTISYKEMALYHIKTVLFDFRLEPDFTEKKKK